MGVEAGPFAETHGAFLGSHPRRRLTLTLPVAFNYLGLFFTQVGLIHREGFATAMAPNLQCCRRLGKGGEESFTFHRSMRTFLYSSSKENVYPFLNQPLTSKNLISWLARPSSRNTKNTHPEQDPRKTEVSTGCQEEQCSLQRKMVIWACCTKAGVYLSWNVFGSCESKQRRKHRCRRGEASTPPNWFGFTSCHQTSTHVRFSGLRFSLSKRNNLLTYPRASDPCREKSTRPGDQ